MTQNPYAQFGQPGFGGEVMEPLDRRTSILAVLSLISALLCFLPGAGALAAILGGAAVIFISQSRGRLGGMGMAITGVVLGLLFSIFWIAVFVGVTSFVQMANSALFAPAGQVIQAIDKGDRTAARAMLTRTADTAITDEMLDDFGQRVRAEMGAFKETPTGPFDIFAGYLASWPRLKAIQGHDDLIPFPVKYERGPTMAVVEIDQGTAQSGKSGAGANFKMPIVNVGVIGLSGSVIWLMPPEDSYKLRIGPSGPRTPIRTRAKTSAPADDAGEPSAPADSPEAPEPPDAPDKPDSVD